jgi:plastocyanin
VGSRPYASWEMQRGSALISLVAVASLVLASGAIAGYGGGSPGGQTPAVTIDANGNAVTDNLGFDPENVSVKVGEGVAWYNTDTFAPHTATEDHGLWDETGTYGSPGPFVGFGPGETVQRTFDGGTFHYYCQVHGKDAMHGVVRVPDAVSAVHHSGAGYSRVKWGAQELPNGQVFDVQRRAGGHWKTVRNGTSKLHGLFHGTSGKYRSRVREAADHSAASDWSPPASA